MSGKDLSGWTVIGPRGQGVDPRLAHQHGVAVDLGGAGAALGRLAVPAAGEVAVLGLLDLVDGVEHHHPHHLGDLVGGVARLAAGDALEDAERQGGPGEPALRLGRLATSPSGPIATAGRLRHQDASSARGWTFPA